ncbi:MAG TPA: hypothetical protein VEJ38_09745 [Candidatus Acidoferrales bacterium]|nr:hypothetical protein [Candidatus Acidoferrales bacterium]
MGTHRSRAILFAVVALMLAPFASAQQPSKSADAPKQVPSGAGTSDIQRETEQYPEAAKAANDAMSMPGMDMNMNPHMYMTELQPKGSGDDRRAEEILDILRRSISKYKDYKVAVADGYQIFLPKVQQPMYHFTNYRYAFAAAFIFNPAHPTSLLYRKTGDGYELLGAMYTAPKNATEQQLNDRVPLSIARWHEHVNLCMPPKGTPLQQADWKQFGLAGSIASQGDCMKANGIWIPQIFGWMVHVYPFESDPEKIWAH